AQGALLLRGPGAEDVGDRAPQVRCAGVSGPGAGDRGDKEPGRGPQIPGRTRPPPSKPFRAFLFGSEPRGLERRGGQSRRDTESSDRSAKAGADQEYVSDR